ncbi:TetR/AcrR family transcriptional regulator [Burkholderia ubonensis]|uniref:TetR/AcrR family transcriptional regulator n=1 Tax=Burkholderia ubonensis TaxID=101571 RepID=UPI000758ECB8|nr:TetR/AcrR family transcriptional regulator [Burkholderia ubonensis]KVZ05151.1 TetR family transcriptional regulator [Burkholderia ubonensis]
MLTRDHWIAAGFDALGRDGHAGVSAERLARRLNVTRGSFYHHFRNREAFVRALLDEWESDCTGRRLAYAAEGRSLEDVFGRYLTIAGERRPERDIAIRAWARRDPLVAEYQARVDGKRLSFAISVCRTRIDGPADADLVGHVAHLCLIGGQHAGARNQAADFARLAQQALAMLRR